MATPATKGWADEDGHGKF